MWHGIHCKVVWSRLLRTLTSLAKKGRRSANEEVGLAGPRRDVHDVVRRRRQHLQQCQERSKGAQGRRLELKSYANTIWLTYAHVNNAAVTMANMLQAHLSCCSRQAQV